MTTDYADPPGVPDLSGPLPLPWKNLLESIGNTDVDSRNQRRYGATLQTWILFTDLRARQLQAEQDADNAKTTAAAAEKQAAALVRATWVLAVATIVLVIVTIVGAFAG